MPRIQISIPVSIFKEDKAFVAYTPALDVSTCADTLAEVKKRFAELVGIFFEELERKGTTNEVLESMGWTMDTKIPKPLLASPCQGREH